MLFHDLLSRSDYKVLDVCELFNFAYERDHDFGNDIEACLFAHVDGRFYDSACLHFGNFGIRNRESASAMAHHRVKLVETFNRCLELFKRKAHFLRKRRNLLILMRQELMKRRVEEADRYRTLFHCLVDTLKVAALHRKELVESLTARLFRFGHYHLADSGDTIFLEEHMLCAAKADALRTELNRNGGISRIVSIRANLERTD